MALDPACESGCGPALIVDGSVPTPPSTVGGCTWTATYANGEGAMGSEYSTVSLTNVGSTVCPTPTIGAVTGTTADGRSVPAQRGDVIGGLGPAPPSVQPGAAVQITIVTTTSADICGAASRQVTSLTVDIGSPLPVTLPSPLETACQFSVSQPGTAQLTDRTISSAFAGAAGRASSVRA